MKVTIVQLFEPDVKPGEIKHTEQKVLGTGETAISYVFCGEKENEIGKSINIKHGLSGKVTRSTVESFSIAVSETVKNMTKNMPEKMRERCRTEFAATIIADLGLIDGPIGEFIKSRYSKTIHEET